MMIIEDLIKTADNMCEALDKASLNEKSFSDNVCHELEKMNWEMLRMTNDLKALRSYIEGSI